ncbi:MAG: hypothetical protein SR1Q7_10070 [Quinella sp. 1Q7]|nr:hypothetical protein [Quinella sp. 1Q7]
MNLQTCRLEFARQMTSHVNATAHRRKKFFQTEFGRAERRIEFAADDDTHECNRSPPKKIFPNGLRTAQRRVEFAADDVARECNRSPPKKFFQTDFGRCNVALSLRQMMSRVNVTARRRKNFFQTDFGRRNVALNLRRNNICGRRLCSFNETNMKLKMFRKFIDTQNFLV